MREAIECGCTAKPMCIDSRSCEKYGEKYRRRRYRCPTCNLNWTTVEVAVWRGDGKRDRAIPALRKYFGTHLSDDLMRDLAHSAATIQAFCDLYEE